MPLPAHQLLHPACPIKPAWAAFDPAWYLYRHADARTLCENKPPEAAILYYLRIGARLGHSPSPLFDETWYLATYPDITELVRAGNYASGFDHYCQHGHRTVSPHWLFDDALYASLYEDMTLENLAQHHCHGRYDHYLKTGQRERRMGHFLFDGAYYRAQALAAGIQAETLDAQGPYVHFLTHLDPDELPPSIYFDPDWYTERHPGAKAEIARGRYTSAIHHYLTAASPEHLDPVPQFSESFYRRRHPDIQAAIENGFYRSAYQQFVQYGAYELRQPSPDIDLSYYRDMHERVRNDLNSGAVRDAFAHLRQIGVPEHLAYCPPDAKPTLSESDARDLFLKKSRLTLTLFARHRMDFTCKTEPALAVIMVLYNRFELTLQALASLRANHPGAIQLILIDNGSADDTARIAAYVQGATLLHNTTNTGFIRAANQALAHVTAPALLYLNNDVELAFGAIPNALARLHSTLNIGAVGAKIIRTNGLLQEAGSVIWNEGTTIGYMRDASPLCPEANFVREVDYASAVFLLCRTSLVKSLNGFDEAFAPAYFEDADLCVRAIQAGFKIVYDPAVTVHHLEFGSAATTEASMALMRRGKRIFKTKHKPFLATQLAPSTKTLVQARSRGRKPKLLFIEDTIPVRRYGSGFVRSNDIIHAIAVAGYEVHVLPINGAILETPSLFGDLPDSTEILHDRDFVNLPSLLEERRTLYDRIWIARTHNFSRILPLLRKAGMDSTPIILDTEALATRRAEASAKLVNLPYDTLRNLKKELANAQLCRKILCVNETESNHLRALGLSQTTTLGTAIQPSPTPAPFAARDGLLFVGAIHQNDSPNLDALHFYQNELQPLLAAELGEPPLLHVAGYTTRDIDLTPFAKNPHIIQHGCLDDLTPLYNTTRIFVAPTRFAAGTPYKLLEAAAHGLPIAATTLLATQLGWTTELLHGPDAKRLSHQIARLYTTESLWKKTRKQALARITGDNNFEAFNKKVKEVLDDAPPPSLRAKRGKPAPAHPPPNRPG